MRLNRVIAALVAGMLFASCNDTDVELAPPVFSVSDSSVELSCEAAQPVIKVSSNRTWKIEMPETCDWIEVDPMEGGQEGDDPVDVNVTLTVSAYGQMDGREYTLYVLPDDGALDLAMVTVKQTGAPASIAVSSENPVNDIPNSGGEVTIDIVSNTAWTVAVKDGATAEVTLDKASGSGNGTVTATVDPNLTLDARSATVVVSAAGCDDVDVVLNQKPADIIPEVKVEIPEANVFIDPALYSSLGGTRYFAVKSNVAWTAKVGSGTTAAGVEIKTASGTGDLDKFEVSVGPNKDLDNRKTIEIEFNASGMEPVKATLRQEKGSILTFEFRNQDNSNSAWPFDQAVGEAGNPGPGTYTAAGYSIVYNAPTESFMEVDASKGSWRIGKGVETWIQSPAIAGRKLSRVSVADYNTGHNPSIVSADGLKTVVKKGRYEDLDKPLTRDVIVTWTLAGTQAGTSYRFACNADKTMRIKYLVFEYAEPSAPDPAYLSADPVSIADIPYAGGSAIINVSSNTAWTAAVKSGATASVTLEATSGSGDGTIGLTIGANADEEAKTAVVVVSASGCPDVEVALTQVKAPAVASIDATLATKDNTWYMDPGVLPSTGSNPAKANAQHGRRPICINAKKAWTAQLGAGTTAADVVLSKTSGTAGLDTLYVSTGPNTDFDKEKKVIVELLAESEAPVQVELVQQPAKILTFEFRTYDRSAVCWPFEEEAYTETGHSGSGTYTAGNCTVGYNAKTDNMIESGHGWRLTSGSDCYIETPVVTGHKLVKVSIADGNANTNPHIITTGGDEVTGGAFADKAGTYSKGGVVTWTLTGTENGKAYRISPTANKTMRTYHLVLEYE